MSESDPTRQELLTHVTQQNARIHDRIDDVASGVHELNVSVAQMQTTLKAQLGVQQQMNDHLARVAEDHGREIRGLAAWRAQTDQWRTGVDDKHRDHAAKIESLQNWKYWMAGIGALIVMVLPLIYAAINRFAMGN